MSIYGTARRVVKFGNEATICPIRVREIASEIIRVSIVTCCYQRDSPCLVQGADKTFQCTDVSTATDYSGAMEITFDVWDKRPTQSGAAVNLLSKSLTGSDIILPDDNVFQFQVTNSESAAIDGGIYWYEVWVTQSTGDRRLVGAGPFRVIDTRKHDA